MSEVEDSRCLLAFDLFASVHECLPAHVSTHMNLYTLPTHTESPNQNQNETVELPNSLDPFWVPCFRPTGQHPSGSTDAHGYNGSWRRLCHPPPPFITPGTISRKMLRGSGRRAILAAANACCSSVWEEL